jgi:hypothetical protein
MPSAWYELSACAGLERLNLLTEALDAGLQAPYALTLFGDQSGLGIQHLLLAITSQEVPMSTQFKAPIGLVPVERRWPKALAALFRRKKTGTFFRAPTGTRFRKHVPSRGARR